MKNALGRLHAIGRIREAEQAIGADDDVVGAVQPGARPGLGQRLNPATVPIHPRDAPAVLLTEDDSAVLRKRLTVGGSCLIAKDRERAALAQPVGTLGPDVLEQERPVRTPERPLRELEAVGQKLQRVAVNQAGKPGVAMNRDHDDEPPARWDEKHSTTVRGA
jgi:hypothetical protein